MNLFSMDGHASCGGDARRGVVVYVTFDGDRFHQLVHEVSQGEDERWVVAGGQASAYQARCVVSIYAAAKGMRPAGWWVYRSTVG